MKPLQAQLDALLRVERKYVDVRIEGATLWVEARLMRVEEGDRFVIIDHRATLPCTLRRELDDVLELLRELSTAVSESKGTAAPSELERFERMRVVVAAERDEGMEKVGRDVLMDKKLPEVARAKGR